MRQTDIIKAANAWTKLMASAMRAGRRAGTAVGGGAVRAARYAADVPAGEAYWSSAGKGLRRTARMTMLPKLPGPLKYAPHAATAYNIFDMGSAKGRYWDTLDADVRQVSSHLLEAPGDMARAGDMAYSTDSTKLQDQYQRAVDQVKRQYPMEATVANTLARSGAAGGIAGITAATAKHWNSLPADAQEFAKTLGTRAAGKLVRM